MKHQLPIWAQMLLHFFFLVLWGAQAGDLLPAGAAGHWLILIAGSAQTVLGIYGIYTPPPSRGGETPGAAGRK